MIKVAIFASGSGSNAEAIMKYFQNHTEVEISVVCCNKPQAGVIERAAKFNKPVVVFNRQQFSETDELFMQLKKMGIQIIALAGFLWLIPPSFTTNFKMLNIHPSLLPKYGGKGMFGINVHRAVKAAGDLVSGITIHEVNEKYDEGAVLFQEKCELTIDDTPEIIASKVLKLEHQFYPRVIEKIAAKGDNF